MCLSSLQVKHGHSKLVWCALIGKTFYYYRNHEDRVIPFSPFIPRPSFPISFGAFFTASVSQVSFLVVLLFQQHLFHKENQYFSDFIFLSLNDSRLKRQVIALSLITLHLVPHLLHLVLCSLLSRLFYSS